MREMVFSQVKSSASTGDNPLPLFWFSLNHRLWAWAPVPGLLSMGHPASAASLARSVLQAGCAGEGRCPGAGEQ